MFPMDPNNSSYPPLPLMMGVIAGQQAMQRAAQEEQTAALEEQNFWLKWTDPHYQSNFQDWWMGADWDTRTNWWVPFARRHTREQAMYVSNLIAEVVTYTLDEDEQAEYRAARDASTAAYYAREQQQANTRPHKTKKGWFRK